MGFLAKNLLELCRAHCKFS